MFFISGEKRTHYLASLASLQNASTFHTRHPPLVHKPSSFVAQKSLRRSGTNIIKHKLFALSRPINKLRPKFKTHFSISAKPSRFFHNPMQKNTNLTFLPLADESINYGLNLERIFQYGQHIVYFHFSQIIKQVLAHIRQINIYGPNLMYIFFNVGQAWPLFVYFVTLTKTKIYSQIYSMKFFLSVSYLDL